MKFLVSSKEDRYILHEKNWLLKLYREAYSPVMWGSFHILWLKDPYEPTSISWKIVTSFSASSTASSNVCFLRDASGLRDFF